MLCASDSFFYELRRYVSFYLYLYCIVISAPCRIEAQSYGADVITQFYGYVMLNGVAVWQASWGGEYPNYRGANVIIVDLPTCTLHEWRTFDLHSDSPTPAYQLRDYLTSLSNGTVLVGVSCDEPSRWMYLASDTLSALGADVSDVGWRGAWVFVAEKGDPDKTVLDKALTQSAANARQPRINTTFARA